MLAALRRCSASLPRTVSSVAVHSRVLRAGTSSTPLGAIRICVARPPGVVAAFHQAAQWRNQAAAATEADVGLEDASQEVTKFADLEARGLIDPTIIRTITRDMGFETMTPVQAASINSALAGTDMIAQAKTGTGKTMGFLLPVVQNVIQKDPRLARGGRVRANASDIRAIIISPTRELAEQIAAEASRLTRNTSIIVQTAVGGTRKREHLERIRRNGCHILVGTPGRLADIFNDPYSGVSAPKIDTLVYDEADRLLDQGFQDELEKIQSALPPIKERPRQTLMFSATVPREVVSLVRQTLRPGFQFVKTIRDDEEPTHHRVPQKVINVPGFENMLPTVLELAQREIRKAEQDGTRPFKAIVFFNSTAEVKLWYDIIDGMESSGGFRRGQGSHPLYPAHVLQIHSRLTQAQRTRSSESFRRAKSAILLSSDVAARGMDFPNVTHVIQVGLPRDDDTYIHRLGRTARAGKEGEGWLLITELEAPVFHSRFRHIPLVPAHDELESARIDMSKEANVPESVATLLNQVGSSMKKIPPSDLSDTYKSYFGGYDHIKDKQGLVEAMNNLAKYGWGMPQPPPLSAALVQRLGLNRLRNLQVRSGRPQGGFNSDRRGSDRYGGGYTDRRGGSSFGDRSGGRDFADRRGGRSFDDRQGGRGFDNRQGGRGFDNRQGVRGFNDRRDGRGFNDRGRSSFGRDFESKPRRDYNAFGSE